MRSYKSIERPAQVLGMNVPDLGLVVGLFLTAVLAIGLAGLVVAVPRFLYLLLLVVLAGVLYGLRYLARHRPPGFLLSWLSFHRRQPRRIALGRPRPGAAGGAAPAPFFPHEHLHR